MVDYRKIDAFFNGETAFEKKEASTLCRRARLLRLAKLLMPSLAAVLIALLLLFPSLKDNDVVQSLDVTLPKKGELEKLHMEKTEFSITDKNNKISTFFADLVDETKAGSKLLKIINPAGVLSVGENKFINIDSDIGYYNQAAQIIELKQNVVAVYDEGTTAETEYARYDFKANYGNGNQQVYAYGAWGKLWAEGFKYYQEKELIVLTGKSKVKNEDNTLWADKEIRYYRTENRLEAEQNVKAVNLENTMYADLMKTFFVAGSQKEIEKIEAYGNVRIIDDANTIYADKMIALMRADKKNTIEKIEAFDNVKVVTSDGTANGNYGLYFPEKNEVELRHNVIIIQDGNVIKGDKAVTNLTTSVSKVLADKTNKKRVSGVITGATVKGEKHDEK